MKYVNITFGVVCLLLGFLFLVVALDPFGAGDSSVSVQAIVTGLALQSVGGFFLKVRACIKPFGVLPVLGLASFIVGLVILGWYLDVLSGPGFFLKDLVVAMIGLLLALAGLAYIRSEVDKCVSDGG